MDNYNPQQGSQPNMPQGVPPDNNLVWAILSTVLCCLPLGIVAIIKSTQVNSKWQMGDIQGAQQAAADAKKYAMWGAIAGIIVMVIYMIFMFLGFGGALLSGASNMNNFN